jgi:proline dehydrogenase
MSLGRNILLWSSRNEWLKKRFPKFKFTKRAVKKFMPGETVEDAIAATRKLLENNIPTTFTHLGENITTLKEAEENTQHYLALLDKINSENLDIEISIKLTQIGFDLSFDKTFELFSQIAAKTKSYNNFVFIDIEDSSYVDNTIDFYKIIKRKYDNVCLCLQTYLYRTMKDIEQMMDINPTIRLVKGAYKEPETVAFKSKTKVDENFLKLSEFLLDKIKDRNWRAAFATHDMKLIKQIEDVGARMGIEKSNLEFHMLYGIKTSEQLKLAAAGYGVRVLISYGEAWFPWYMRRLAERPANVGFVLKNLFSK